MRLVKQKNLKCHRRHYVLLEYLDEKTGEYSIQVNDMDREFKEIEKYSNLTEDDAVFYYNKWSKKYNDKLRKINNKRKVLQIQGV